MSRTAVTGIDLFLPWVYAGVDLQAHEINLTLNGFELFTAGQPVAYDAAQVSKSTGDNFEAMIELSVGTGSGKAGHWTSDFAVDCVRFNSEYTT